MMQALLTLGLIGLLAWALIHLQRRGSLAGKGGPIELYGRLPLDARRAVYLVKVGEQILVLGASEAGLRHLLTLPASEVPAAGPLPPSLAEKLARKLSPAASESENSPSGEQQ